MHDIESAIAIVEKDDPRFSSDVSYWCQNGMGGRAIISQKINSTAANAGNPKLSHHRKKRW
jgi:hypothetical protein